MLQTLELATGTNGGDNYVTPEGRHKSDNGGQGRAYGRISLAALEASAHHPPSNIISVNSGIALERQGMMPRREVVAPLAGFITVRHEMPTIIRE